MSKIPAKFWTGAGAHAIRYLLRTAERGPLCLTGGPSLKRPGARAAAQVAVRQRPRQ
jgi:hypothetical protein